MSAALLVLPDALVAVAALACLLQPWAPRVPRAYTAGLVALLLVAALGAELVFGGRVVTLQGGGFEQDRFTLFGKAVLIGVSLLVVVASDWEELGPAALGLNLLACLGGLVVASSADLVSTWSGLALAAVAGLALQARRDPLTARRLLPALAGLLALAAVGMAMVAGAAGSGSLLALHARLGSPFALPLAVAVLVVVAAILGQLAAGPWLGPLTAGAAGLALLKFAGAVSGLGAAWAVLLPVLAAAAMLAAGLGALSGGPGRRILGWAGLLQLGWIVAGLAGGSRPSLGAALFLLGAYLAASAAGPPVLGEVPHGLAGLSDRSAVRAAGFTVCLLSLAGVPPLAGFFGELAIAGQLVRAGLFWLVALGFFGSALVAFAVLRDLRLVYLASPGEALVAAAPRRLVSGGAALSAAVLVAYVFFANPISGLAVQGAAALGLR